MTVRQLCAILSDIKDQDLQVMMDDAGWPGPTRVLVGVSRFGLEVVRDSLSHGHAPVVVDQDLDNEDITVDGVVIRNVIVLS